MTQGRHYTRMAILGIVIGLCTLFLGLAGEQIYHRLLSSKCAKQYTQTHDVAVLAEGFYHITSCIEVGEDIPQQMLYYTKELIDCGEWNTYYAESKYGKKYGSIENPELAMKFTYLQLTLLYNEPTRYLEAFTQYYPTMDISERMAYIGMFASEDFIQHKDWQQMYDTIVQGYISLSEKESSLLEKSRIYTELASFCDSVQQPNDANNYTTQANEYRGKIGDGSLIGTQGDGSYVSTKDE